MNMCTVMQITTTTLCHPAAKTRQWSEHPRAVMLNILTVCVRNMFEGPRSAVGLPLHFLS